VADPLLKKDFRTLHCQVKVAHVVNDPVNIPLPPQVPVTLTDGSTIVSMDIPLFYPNPLANDPQFKDYSPDAMYQVSIVMHVLCADKFRVRPMNTLNSLLAMMSWRRRTQKVRSRQL